MGSLKPPSCPVSACSLGGAGAGDAALRGPGALGASRGGGVGATALSERYLEALDEEPDEDEDLSIPASERFRNELHRPRAQARPVQGVGTVEAHSPVYIVEPCLNRFGCGLLRSIANQKKHLRKVLRRLVAYLSLLALQHH